MYKGLEKHFHLFSSRFRSGADFKVRFENGAMNYKLDNTATVGNVHSIIKELRLGCSKSNFCHPIWKFLIQNDFPPVYSLYTKFVWNLRQEDADTLFSDMVLELRDSMEFENKTILFNLVESLKKKQEKKDIIDEDLLDMLDELDRKNESLSDENRRLKNELDELKKLGDYDIKIFKSNSDRIYSDDLKRFFLDSLVEGDKVSTIRRHAAKYFHCKDINEMPSLGAVYSWQKYLQTAAYFVFAKLFNDPNFAGATLLFDQAHILREHFTGVVLTYIFNTEDFPAITIPLDLVYTGSGSAMEIRDNIWEAMKPVIKACEVLKLESKHIPSSFIATMHDAHDSPVDFILKGDCPNLKLNFKCTMHDEENIMKQMAYSIRLLEPVEDRAYCASLAPFGNDHMNMFQCFISGMCKLFSMGSGGSDPNSKFGSLLVSFSEDFKDFRSRFNSNSQRFYECFNKLENLLPIIELLPSFFKDKLVLKQGVGNKVFCTLAGLVCNRLDTLTDEMLVFTLLLELFHIPLKHAWKHKAELDPNGDGPRLICLKYAEQLNAFNEDALNVRLEEYSNGNFQNLPLISLMADKKPFQSLLFVKYSHLIKLDSPTSIPRSSFISKWKAVISAALHGAKNKKCDDGTYEPNGAGIYHYHKQLISPNSSYNSSPGASDLKRVLKNAPMNNAPTERLFGHIGWDVGCSNNVKSPITSMEQFRAKRCGKFLHNEMYREGFFEDSIELEKYLKDHQGSSKQRRYNAHKKIAKNLTLGEGDTSMPLSRIVIESDPAKIAEMTAEDIKRMMKKVKRMLDVGALSNLPKHDTDRIRSLLKRSKNGHPLNAEKITRKMIKLSAFDLDKFDLWRQRASVLYPRLTVDMPLYPPEAPTKPMLLAIPNPSVTVANMKQNPIVDEKSQIRFDPIGYQSPLENDVSYYCPICKGRYEEIGDEVKWVGCDGPCQRWFHFDCVGLEEVLHIWVCPDCINLQNTANAAAFDDIHTHLDMSFMGMGNHFINSHNNLVPTIPVPIPDPISTVPISTVPIPHPIPDPISTVPISTVPIPHPTATVPISVDAIPNPNSNVDDNPVEVDMSNQSTMEPSDPSLCPLCLSTNQNNVNTEEWIQCDTCNKWFHYGCVQLLKAPSGKWFCPICEIPSCKTIPNQIPTEPPYKRRKVARTRKRRRKNDAIGVSSKRNKQNSTRHINSNPSMPDVDSAELKNMVKDRWYLSLDIMHRLICLLQYQYGFRHVDIRILGSDNNSRIYDLPRYSLGEAENALQCIFDNSHYFFCFWMKDRVIVVDSDCKKAANGHWGNPKRVPLTSVQITHFLGILFGKASKEAHGKNELLIQFAKCHLQNSKGGDCGVWMEHNCRLIARSKADNCDLPNLEGNMSLIQARKHLAEQIKRNEFIEIGETNNGMISLSNRAFSAKLTPCCSLCKDETFLPFDDVLSFRRRILVYLEDKNRCPKCKEKERTWLDK